ncbi:Retrovirus-related Pol polyprotein from transposon 17.6 Protease [Scomber scombrus]|uniref:Retrovirus-related Pol polyprotein from transposon 17.6 Protease n=1 Tax=Scomber scombrus TaxID=13677 RepID=A0AAV1PGW9_SCOSC
MVDALRQRLQSTVVVDKVGPSKELPISIEAVWKAQQGDPECQALYQRVVENGKVAIRANTSFTIMEDLLYRVISFTYLPASGRAFCSISTKTPSLVILEGIKPTGDCNIWSIGRS